MLAHVTRGHAYSNPVLLVTPEEGGPVDYLAWLAAETATK